MGSEPTPNPAPAFQLYAADFLAETDELSVEAVGVYIRLLARDWRANGLPIDVDSIAIHARISKRLLKSLWHDVGPFFPVDPEDATRRRNPALHLQRQRTAAYRATMAANGKRGGRPRKAEGFPEKSTSLSTSPNYLGTTYPHENGARANGGRMRDSGKVEGSISDQADIFGAADVRRKRKAAKPAKEPSYVVKAAATWQTHRGVPSYPLIGAALKKVAAEIGEAEALAAWERFCIKSTANPGHFPGNFRKYLAAPATFAVEAPGKRDSSNVKAIARIERSAGA